VTTTCNSCFWLVDFQKIFSFETAWPYEPKLGRCFIYMYGRFCIKFPQSRMRGEWYRLGPLSL
jgi:hypothetical protein